MADNKLISEEYIIKEWEAKAAHNMAGLMGALGAGRAQHWYENNLTNGDNWSRESHFWWASRHGDSKKRNWLRFTNHNYLDESGVVYGKPRVTSQVNEDIPGTAQTFDNSKYNKSSHETYTREVEKFSKVEHVLNEAHELTIKSETTVKGSYSGVEFEQKLEAAYGFKLDKSQTEEESTTEKETVSDEFDVDSGEIVVCTVERERMIVESPYNIDAIFDCSLEIDLENWAGLGTFLWGGKSHTNNFKFDNLTDFERFLMGYDVTYPKMKNFKMNDQGKRCMAWLFDPSHRSVKSTGVKRRTFDNSVRFKKNTL